MSDEFEMEENDWNEWLRDLSANLLVLECPECHTQLPFDRRKFVPGFEVTCSECGFSEPVQAVVEGDEE